MRRLRQEVKAEAKIAKELSGVDAKAQEAEFLEFARTSGANSEFDALIGLGEAADSAPKDKESRGSEGPATLPE
jgi:hypothetical protein